METRNVYSEWPHHHLGGGGGGGKTSTYVEYESPDGPQSCLEACPSQQIYQVWTQLPAGASQRPLHCLKWPLMARKQPWWPEITPKVERSPVSILLGVSIYLQQAILVFLGYCFEQP